jgi:hypothetical protein
VALANGRLAAFALLRAESQNTGRKLSDVALSLVESNQLSVPRAPTPKQS